MIWGQGHGDASPVCCQEEQGRRRKRFCDCDTLTGWTGDAAGREEGWGDLLRAESPTGLHIQNVIQELGGSEPRCSGRGQVLELEAPGPVPQLHTR